MFVEALGAGPRVLQRRAPATTRARGSIIDAGRTEREEAGEELPPLTAEVVIGAAFGVIYGRLIHEQPARPLGGFVGAR